VTTVIESVRQAWEESHRRLEAASGDRRLYLRLLDQVETVLSELRRRIGQTFTLAQLADEYHRADDWARDAVLDRGESEDEDEAPSAASVATVAVAQGAAFYVYARSATDYSP
jgi:hypothetical protein